MGAYFNQTADYNKSRPTRRWKTTRNTSIFSIKSDFFYQIRSFNQIQSFRSNSIFSVKFDLFNQIRSFPSSLISSIFPIKSDLFDQIRSFLSNLISSIKFGSFRSNSIYSIKSDLFDQIRCFRFFFTWYRYLGFFTWYLSWVPTLLSSSSSSTSCSWYLVSQMYNSLPSAHWSGNQSSCSILCVGAGSAGYHVCIPVFRTLHVIVLWE